MNVPRRRSVLVVEDSDEDFAAIEEVIRRTGHADAVRATTAEKGLAMLRSASLAERTAMVLLDLNTPGSDGRDVLRAIKSDASLQAVPVVVLSTSANPRDIGRCYRSGANGYHVKPFDPGEFEGLVEKIIQYWLFTSAPFERGRA